MITAVDIAGFGAETRDDEIQLFLRGRLYALLQYAFRCAGISWCECYHEDRGDGIICVFPPDVSPAALIEPLVRHLRTALRRHNRLASDVAQIRMRMALHAGFVWFDSYGIAGTSVVRLFRLIEAPAFKHSFGTADFGLVTSDEIYQKVINSGADADRYVRIPIQVKETETRAWMYIPELARGGAMNAENPLRRSAAQ